MMVSDIWPPFCPIHMDSSLSPRERRIIAGSRKKSLSHNIHEKFRNPKAALLRNRCDRDTKEICLSLRREASHGHEMVSGDCQPRAARTERKGSGDGVRAFCHFRKTSSKRTRGKTVAFLIRPGSTMQGPLKTSPRNCYSY